MSFFSRSFPTLNRLKQLAFRPRGVEEFFEAGKSIPTEKSWTGKFIHIFFLMEEKPSAITLWQLIANSRSGPRQCNPTPGGTCTLNPMTC